jgi:hypothetical protein
MIRPAHIAALACLLLACQRGKEQAVTIVPGAYLPDAHLAPPDPFGSASGAYAKLREVTDAAIAENWNGELGDFAAWLEEETVAIERALGLLKALRLGSSDVYAVANGRIAMVYEHIALGLTKASAAAEATGYDADWRGEEGRVWNQASAFWARCARGCSTGGAHLDAWDLRCRHGWAHSDARSTARAK